MKRQLTIFWLAIILAFFSFVWFQPDVHVDFVSILFRGVWIDVLMWFGYTTISTIDNK